jgi:hypothetical protein
MPLRVAICGDSAMWGQGLIREHTYAHLAAAKIAASLDQDAEVEPGRSLFDPLRGEARSGAKIRPSDTDADAFIDRFPLFVTSEKARLDLKFARDESPGALLFGEHPATFPTITDAVRHLGARNGAQIGLVLMDGGINDIDFEEVLDPEGPDMSRIVKELRAIFGDSLNQLLRETRIAFPNAVIIIVGYFSPLTEDSDKDELERLFKYLADKPEWQVAANDAVQELPVVREFLNSFLTKDVDALIRKAIRRSKAAAAQAHFWTRRTVAGLPSSVIGPGILYAHPGFRPHHGLFAGAQTLFHDGYRPPGDGRHAVADEMLPRRLDGENIPRRRLLGDYRALHTLVGALLLPNAAPPLEALAPKLRSLMAENDLPVSLRSAAQAVVDRETASRLVQLSAALEREIGRIEIATIASFVHPNEAGARRCADRIAEAYEDHRRFSIRKAVASMRLPGRSLRLRAAVKQHGLDPAKGIRRLAAFAHIESVGVQFEGLASGFHPIVLSLGGAEVECTVARSGSNRAFLAFDMALELGDLSEVSIASRPVIGGPLLPQLGLPQFDRLTVFLNAREFLTLAARDGRIDDGKLILWPAR